jgi:hypothetical protein
MIHGEPETEFRWQTRIISVPGILFNWILETILALELELSIQKL